MFKKYRDGKEFLRKYIECEKNNTPLLKSVVYEFIRNAPYREVGYFTEYVSNELRKEIMEKRIKESK